MLTRKQIERRYYLKHIEKLRKKNKKWREQNPHYAKKWQANNLDRLRKYRRQWIKDHPERTKEIADKYYRNNINKLRERDRLAKSKKRKTDPSYHINNVMSRSIRASLKGNKDGRHWEDLFGYTSKVLTKHLKKTIPKGYTWQDFLSGKLHLDHKVPMSAFNFSKPEHIDFKRCWALTNLQLLPAKENLVKNAKLSEPFQPALKI